VLQMLLWSPTKLRLRCAITRASGVCLSIRTSFDLHLEPHALNHNCIQHQGSDQGGTMKMADFLLLNSSGLNWLL
jgi:hypothetical protein